jgi:xanthine dehydrogenase accessory factor
MTPEILAALEAAKQAKRPVVLATRLPSGEQSLLPDPDAPDDLNAAAQRALDRDESGTVKIGETDWFLHAYNPPLRLIVVGAVHIAQALVPFAVPCGFAVTVVDPRRSGRGDFHRLAGRGAGRLRPRQPHRRGDADARPEAG